MLDPDRRAAGPGQHRLGRPGVPGPGVAEPRGRQHMHGVGVRAGVGHPDGHQHVGRVGLGVPDLGDPVPVIVEHAGVQQLVLHVELAAPAVFRQQVLIRERGLRVVVPPPVPGVARDGVQVPPVLLHVLAVVGLLAGQPVRALLQDRIAAVPQRQPQAQPLLHVAEPGQAVLTPPVGAGPGGIVRQVIPRPAVRAVILPDRAPLPLTHIRPPQIPVAGLPQPVLQPPEPSHPIPFGAHRSPLRLVVQPFHGLPRTRLFRGRR